MRKLEHAQHARNPDRAPADYRFCKRDRFPVPTEETIRSCRSGRGLAAVVASQALVAFGPVEQERAPADARGLGLDQAEHHLNRNHRVEGRAAAPKDVVPGIDGERVRRRNDEPRAAFPSSQLRAGSDENKEERRKGGAKTRCAQHPHVTA